MEAIAKTRPSVDMTLGVTSFEPAEGLLELDGEPVVVPVVDELPDVTFW